MVICHCRAVSDGLVRAAVAAGADIDAIIAQCGAGSVCGGCRPTIARLLDDLATAAVTATAGSGDGVAVAIAPRRAA